MFDNGVRRIKTAIHNPQLIHKLLRWLGQTAWPYKGSILFIFLINAISIVISYGSTIIGKYVIDDATSGVINARNMAMMCVTSALAILIGIGSRVLGDYVNERFTFGVRVKMFSDIQRSTWQNVTKFHSGDLLTRLTSDVGTVSSGLISIIPSIIMAVIQLLLAFGILYYYDHTIAVFALIMGPIGAVAGLIFRKKYFAYQQALRENESEYRSFMQERLEHITVMKTFQQEKINDRKNEQIRLKRLQMTLRSSRLAALMVALFRIIYNISYMVAFCWGAYRISTGTITYGTMTIFITLVSQIQGTLSNMAGMVQQMFSMLVSAKRIYDVSELEKETAKGLTTVPEKVGVHFSHVDFAYDKDLILKDIALDICPGQKAAIVGESGAGKTTLIRLLLALTKPTHGMVEFQLPNKQKEIACPDSRRYISYVPQGNTLITGTIAENLRVGKEDATEEEMWHALEMAGAGRFMKKLDLGLDTTLSEKAGGISEGQAQRIAIARALISDKPFMILDEATSALDEKTEQEVLENIAKYYQDTTCVIITHRSSMLQYCDVVYRVQEDGTMMQN